MEFLDLFKKYKVDSKDTADLVENTEPGELTLNQAEKITEGTDKHPLYFLFRVNGELTSKDLTKGGLGLPGKDLVFKKYLITNVNTNLSQHVKDMNENAERMSEVDYNNFKDSKEYQDVKEMAEKSNDERAKELLEEAEEKIAGPSLAEKTILGWPEDGFKEYMVNEINQSAAEFIGVLISYSDKPQEKFEKSWNKVMDQSGDKNFWENMAEFENKPIKVNMEPPPVVLNTVNRRDLVTNLSESQRCPFEKETLEKLNENELRDLAGLCEPVADYSGRGVADAFLENKDQVPNIVLNDSNKDD